MHLYPHYFYKTLLALTPLPFFYLAPEVAKMGSTLYQMELNTRSKQSSNSKGKAMARIVEEEEEAEDFFSSSGCGCFLCAIKQPDARLRRASLADFFRELPYYEDDGSNGQSCAAAVGAVWRAAMAAPDDPELPSLGAIRCMSLLLARALADATWCGRGDNVCVP